MRKYGTSPESMSSSERRRRVEILKKRLCIVFGSDTASWGADDEETMIEKIYELVLLQIAGRVGGAVDGSSERKNIVGDHASSRDEKDKVGRNSLQFNSAGIGEAGQGNGSKRSLQNRSQRTDYSAME